MKQRKALGWTGYCAKGQSSHMEDATRSEHSGGTCQNQRSRGHPRSSCVWAPRQALVSSASRRRKAGLLRERVHRTDPKADIASTKSCRGRSHSFFHVGHTSL